MSDYVDDFAIVEAMGRYGGGFVKALANAWRLADSTNKLKLKNAFFDYWKMYEKYARHDALENAE